MNQQIKTFLYFYLYATVQNYVGHRIIDFFGIFNILYCLLAFIVFFIFWYGFFELAKK